MSQLNPIFQEALKPYLNPPRFQSVWCSQCGEEFGPGMHGYSHCIEHYAASRDKDNQRRALELQIKHQGQ